MADYKMKQMSVPLPKPADGEGVELGDEQLERIAGGKLTEHDLEQYKEIMVHFRDERGWTKEKFVSGYAFLPQDEQSQIAELVEQYW